LSPKLDRVAAGDMYGFYVSLLERSMTNRFDHIRVNLQPSYSLAAILIVSHCVATVLIWLLALTIVIKILVTIAIIFSCVYYLRQDALLLNNNAVIAFDLFEKMQCTITTRSGKSIQCLITADSFVTPVLTVIIFKLKKPLSLSPFCSVVILPDRIETNEFRRLRIWLRWKYRQGDTKKQ
jgi:toxin CptA